MRVLVTGGAGFIGSSLVDRLLAEGHDVVALDDLSTGTLDNLSDARARRRFSFVRGDITDGGLPDVVTAAAPDVVFHLAARTGPRASIRDPVEDARRNVLGTVNLLEAARASGARKVVFASSGGAIYGNAARQPVSERVGADPLSPYGAAKISGEIYLGMYRKLYGVRTATLALGNVYGPRQEPDDDTGVVATFCAAMARREPTTIFGDGTNARDFVFVDDVVDAFVRAAEKPCDGRRFNVGSGIATSVRQLHALVAELACRADEPRFADGRLGEWHGVALDVSSARHGLGWEPFTPLREGVSRTLAWVSRSAGG